MPLPKPHKDESQDTFMARCMHEAYGDNAPNDRTQEQAVAMCMQAWRDKDKAKAKASKQDVPEPDDDESHADFMDRCVEELTDDGGIDEDEAQDQCQIAWEDRSAKRAELRARNFSSGGNIRHKTHAGDVGEGMEFIMSDESVDRMGDIISAGGWDIADFQKNPIALFSHASSFPIGAWRDVRVENNALRGKLELAPKGTSPRIDEIRALVEAKILRAVSVGFRSLERTPRKDADGHYVGEHFLRQTLLECSLVSIPANQNALAVAKGLNISDDTLDLVFAEPGNKETKQARRGTTGEPAKSSPHRMSTTMSLSQRVKDQQDYVLGLKDKLAGHLKDLDDTNVSEGQMLATKEFTKSIKEGEAHLASLKEAETALGLQASDGDGDDGGGGDRQITIGVQRAGGQVITRDVDARKAFGLPASKKSAPIDLVVRNAVCLMFAHRYKRSMEECREMIARTFPAYGEDTTRTYLDYVERAATAPAMTTVAGWAQELAQTVYADFMQIIMPFSIYPSLSAKGLSLSFGRAGRIIIPTRNRTPTIAGSFVGEGAPIPVRQGAFSSQTLVPKKLGVITVYTREMSEHSIPAIEGLLRDAIAEDTAVSLDSVLIDANPATAVRPPGLLNGITPLTGTTGGGYNAVIGDIQAMGRALLASTLGHVRAPVWLMNTAQYWNLMWTVNPLGQFPFREEILAGTLGGWPVIHSGTVPAGTIVLIDAADFVSVGKEAPRFEVSDSATLHFEDTTPLDIGTAGTPPVVAAPVKSMWQTDSIALRMIMPVNWVMRRPGMVVATNTLTW